MRSVVALVALALLPLPVASAGPVAAEYSVVDLGTLPGYSVSEAAGINEAGQVVGTLGVPGQTPHTAFVWDSESGFRVLGPVGGRYTVGSGINDEGDVAGSAAGTYDNPGFAFSWSAKRGFHRLHPPPPYFGSAGAGINDAGQVAGTAVLGTVPLRWEANGDVRELGSLGGTTGLAFGINDAGQVVGYSRNSRGSPRPFLWDPVGGMRDLGTFRRGDRSNGIATAVNDRTHVVGDADTRGFGSRGFLWKKGRLIGIGPESNYPAAVNELDHVVGQFYADREFRAFRYRERTFKDLNSLIPGSGVFLTEARGINDAGWIVANGTTRQRQQRAFLLIP